MMRGFYSILAIVTVSSVLCAQPATSPATTTAPTRHAIEVPPGFSRLTIRQHTILVEGADQVWAKDVLQNLSPTTLPATMPSTILDLLTANRQAIAARMVSELAMSDSATVNSLLDDKLVGALRKLQQVSPPLFYFISTEGRVKDLLKTGWSDPRFHYNRISDSVEISMATLTTSTEADDVLVPVLYMAGDGEQVKRQELATAIHSAEQSLAELLGEQSVRGTQTALATFITDEVFAPMKLGQDQQWVAIGLAGALSCRYAAVLTGMPEQRLTASMTSDNPRNPLRATTIDLLHPPDLTSLREEAIAYYADAYRSKSARAMQSWMLRGGDAAIPKLIAELRKSRPADGAGMVQLIQQVSGVDISADVAAGK